VGSATEGTPHTGRREKQVAPRKKTATRKPRAKKATGTKRRKNTREPKRIINRKPRKTRAKKTATKKQTRAPKVAPEKMEALGKKVARLVKRGMTVREAATELGVRPGDARFANRLAGTSSADKITGTPKAVAKKIRAAREAGVSWPDLRARTGLDGATLRQIAGDVKKVKKGGGKATTRKATGTRTRGGKATTTRARKTRATGKPGARKRVAREPVSPEGTAPRKAGRAKRTKRTKTTAGDTKKNSGQLKGRRARRVNEESRGKKRPLKARLKEILKEVVWNLDTDKDDVIEALTDRKIEVSRNFQGRQVRPTEHRIVSVTDVYLHDREGRVIEFIDDNKQTRFVSSREITALKK
jgi:hypothetical protein